MLRLGLFAPRQGFQLGERCPNPMEGYNQLPGGYRGSRMLAACFIGAWPGTAALGPGGRAEWEHSLANLDTAQKSSKRNINGSQR